MVELTYTDATRYFYNGYAVLCDGEEYNFLLGDTELPSNCTKYETYEGNILAMELCDLMCNGNSEDY